MAKKKIRYGMRPPVQAASSPASAPQRATPVQQALVAQGQPKAPAQPKQPAPNVTPQLQATYNQFMNDCYRVLFGPNCLQSTMKLISAHGNPVQGLATAVVMIIIQVQGAYKKNNQPQPPPTVILHGAMELMVNISLASATSGTHIFPPQELAQVAQQALPIYQQQASKVGVQPQGPQQQQNNDVFAPALSSVTFAKQLAASHKGAKPQQPQKGQPPQQQGQQAPAQSQPAPTAPTQGLLTQGAQ